MRAASWPGLWVRGYLARHKTPLNETVVMARFYRRGLQTQKTLHTSKLIPQRAAKSHISRRMARHVTQLGLQRTALNSQISPANARAGARIGSACTKPSRLIAAGRLVGVNKVRATAYWRSASRVMGVVGMFLVRIGLGNDAGALSEQRHGLANQYLTLTISAELFWTFQNGINFIAACARIHWPGG
jgi:hypothetical protein